MRVGRWQLHVHKGGFGGEGPMHGLYDLEADVGETTDLAGGHPEVVAELMAHVERARTELGDAATGVEGTDRRPVGRVADPVPLTSFDPDHPYYISEYDLAEYDLAEYDLADRG